MQNLMSMCIQAHSLSVWQQISMQKKNHPSAIESNTIHSLLDHILSKKQESLFEQTSYIDSVVEYLLYS